MFYIVRTFSHVIQLASTLAKFLPIFFSTVLFIILPPAQFSTADKNSQATTSLLNPWNKRSALKKNPHGTSSAEMRRQHRCHRMMACRVTRTRTQDENLKTEQNKTHMKKKLLLLKKTFLLLSLALGL